MKKLFIGGFTLIFFTILLFACSKERIKETNTIATEKVESKSGFRTSSDFEPNVEYTFRSRKVVDATLTNETFVLTVVFDEENNVTVTKEIDAYQEGDETSSYVKSSDLISTKTKDGYTISNLNDNVLIIPFNDPNNPNDVNAMSASGGWTINIDCSCKEELSAGDPPTLNVTDDGKCKNKLNISTNKYSCSSSSCLGCCEQTTEIVFDAQSADMEEVFGGVLVLEAVSIN